MVHGAAAFPCPPLVMAKWTLMRRFPGLEVLKNGE